MPVILDHRKFVGELVQVEVLYVDITSPTPPYRLHTQRNESLGHTLQVVKISKYKDVELGRLVDLLDMAYRAARGGRRN